MAHTNSTSGGVSSHRNSWKSMDSTSSLFEGDWPPSQRVNRFIHMELDQDLNLHTKDPLFKHRVHEVLRCFKRWPTWMWCNLEVEELVRWMRIHNLKVDNPGTRVGFYGLDVYSLFESIKEALTQLEKVDPGLARKAKLRYACFDPFLEDENEYARSLIFFPEGCREGVVRTLQELLQKRLDSIEPAKHGAFFDAVQNARIVQNAESYYRCMIQADDKSWNVHSTHGDLEILPVPPGRPGSWEAEFHAVAMKMESEAVAFSFEPNKHEKGPLVEVRGNRAIGVVYNPVQEKWGNYVPTSLANRYNAMLFVDVTVALEPLPAEPEPKEIPEAYPTGF